MDEGKMKRKAPTEAEIEATLSRLTPREAIAIRLMRKDLTERGVTREPLRTQMACEFAEVLLLLTEAAERSQGMESRAKASK